MAFWTTHNYWITYFPGSLAALAALITLVWKALSRLGETADRLGKIEYEFSPNGGRSLRDRVDHVYAEQISVASALAVEGERRKALDAKVSQHIEADERRFDRQDAQLDRIEDHVRK